MERLHTPCSRFDVALHAPVLNTPSNRRQPYFSFQLVGWKIGDILSSQDRPYVQQLAHQIQQSFEELLKALEPYPTARAFVENLVKPVTTLLRWWLQKGEALPPYREPSVMHRERVTDVPGRMVSPEMGEASPDHTLTPLTVFRVRESQLQLYRHTWGHRPDAQQPD